MLLSSTKGQLTEISGFWHVGCSQAALALGREHIFLFVFLIGAVVAVVAICLLRRRELRMEQAGDSPEPRGFKPVHSVLCQCKEFSTCNTSNVRWRRASYAVMKYSGCNNLNWGLPLFPVAADICLHILTTFYLCLHKIDFGA